MKARLLIRDRIEFADDAVAHITVWKVPRPVNGSQHDYKSRLAYIVDGECVFRYDNEAGRRPSTLESRGDVLPVCQSASTADRIHVRHHEVEP